MEILLAFAIGLALVIGLFYALIRAGLKLDSSRRAGNNQDLADRINAPR